MSKEFEILTQAISGQEEAFSLMEKLVASGNADAVFSPPVESGQYKVITAAESGITIGLGYGGGGKVSESDQEGEGSPGIGFGGGGGGAAMARPVAFIEIGPNGARVEPIIDPTKIALAFVSMLITVFSMSAKMRRKARM
jgi:uncharacterized spore protein YtfJ